MISFIIFMSISILLCCSVCTIAQALALVKAQHPIITAILREYSELPALFEEEKPVEKSL